MKRFGLGLAALLVGGSSLQAQVVNGGFESPFCSFICINTTVTGWTNYGSIDHIGSLWQAASGNSSIDMNGDFRGGIGQVVTGLTAGRTYDLSFIMSKNPVLASADMDVLWLTANPGANFFTAAPGTLFNYTGSNSSTNMLWTARNTSFVATATSMFLGFRSQELGARGDIRAGAALDDVFLTPGAVSIVPEPTTNALLAGGLFAMFALYRRRRTLR
ncbi:MAG: DUF642 domain-containing protein [Phycisphaerae bacterium]|nr:DUF642 domain-containing protein [Gemmatimonadaceae bacterium]